MRYTQELDDRLKLLGLIPDSVIEGDDGEWTSYHFFYDQGYVIFMVARSSVEGVAFYMDTTAGGQSLTPVVISAITEEMCRPTIHTLSS